MARLPTVESLGTRPIPSSSGNIVPIRGDVGTGQVNSALAEAATAENTVGVTADELENASLDSAERANREAAQLAARRMADEYDRYMCFDFLIHVQLEKVDMQPLFF